MKVAVVDDSDMTHEFCRLALEAAGHQCIRIDSPIGAALVISREQPDVVLMDVHMATVSGDNVCRAVRRDPRNSSMKVLLHSSLPLAELQALAIDCHADGIIEKSGDPAAFVRQIVEAVTAS